MKLPVKDGDVIGDRYVVEFVLGIGGMSVVVVALDLSNNSQRVAIKILLPERAKSEEIRQRFERERRTLSQLESEHNLRVLGGGSHGKCLYTVTEYLEGCDLSEILESEGALPLDRALDYALQASEAVAEAHSLGVIHRDIKPGNLFLLRPQDGSHCVKVLDFGISKAAGHQRELGEVTLTQTTAVFGSPFYMSPEQLISSKDVDERSDIWSLGVTLFEMLTGELPFAEKNTEKICLRILNGKPQPLRELRPDFTVRLEAALLRCMQRNPADRFPTIADFALSLVPVGPERLLPVAERVTRYIQPEEQHEVLDGPTTVRWASLREPDEQDEDTAVFTARRHFRPVQRPPTGLSQPPAQLDAPVLETGPSPSAAPDSASGSSGERVGVPLMVGGEQDRTTAILKPSAPSRHRGAWWLFVVGVVMFLVGVGVGLFAGFSLAGREDPVGLAPTCHPAE